jgi:hypothetical protein
MINGNVKNVLQKPCFTSHKLGTGIEKTDDSHHICNSYKKNKRDSRESGYLNEHLQATIYLAAVNWQNSGSLEKG